MQEAVDTQRAAAERYLNDLAEWLIESGISARAVTSIGLPADAIADYATRHGIGLLVVASHGRSGVARWAYGSVAGKLLHAAPAPLLMLRSPLPAAEPPKALAETTAS